ncbi:MAG: sigma-70 family RNA polymerase sigma factor [Bacteroidetes bacterium]|nr:MAG: sigma-70 family RNA polymerase sigma factor [Bacteroidota bacterium]
MQQKEAFIQTIKDNEGIIYKITRVYAKDTEDQKDLYQEIVYQLWKSFDSFKGKSKLSTWMYRVALNTSIAHLNQNKKSPSSTSGLSLNFELPDAADHSGTSGSEWEDRMHMLYAHIKQLNVIEKGLILLFLEGKSYEEIAAITGFTITNVGTRLGRIKQKLKTNFKK